MSALLALLQQKQKDIAAQSGNKRKVIGIAAGRGRYRILPSWRGEGQQFWHDFGQHYVKNAAGKIGAIYVCTDKTFGRSCAVCDTIASAIQGATDDATMELLKQARAGGKVLVNALHLDGTTPNQVEILALPATVFKMVIDIAAEWEEAGESIFSLDKGKDLIINREGTGVQNTKYTVQAAAKATVLDASITKQLHNLDEYVQQESTEQMNRALNSVRSVAGLLSAPSGPAMTGLPLAAGPDRNPLSGLPLAAAAGAVMTDDDPYAVATPVKPVKPPVEFEDVPELDKNPVAATPAKAALLKPTPAAESTGDADLDDLLSQLGA